jgi:rod shape determining protein RodA
MNKLIKNIDPILLMVIAIIFFIALLSLYSSSHQPDGSMVKNYMQQQLTWMIIAILISFLFIWIGYERLLDYSYIIFFVNILLLLLVLSIGSSRLGAKRWLSLGLFSLQPSELCKISFILALVKYMDNNAHRLGSIRVVITSLIICVVPMLLIIKQPDLGTAIILLPILFIALFTAGSRVRHIAYIIGFGVGSAPLLWNLLKVYQRKRLLVFLNPNADPLGAGYTVIQSKIAVGSGGLFGKGWMSGTQNQLNFLPERHTDFIFSVIGEEWGFFGSILILGLFLLLIRELLKIADATNDKKGKLLVISIVTLLWFQIFINIAMTTGIMPVVGLPLPLVSYGGSSLVTTMALIGLAISVGLKRKIF